MPAQHKAQIASLFSQALTPLLAGTDVPVPVITLERPRDPTHGDIACNIAMQLAKPLKKNPRELAQAIVDAVLANPARVGLIDAIELAGPGFINLRVARAIKQSIIKRVLQDAACYGKTNDGAGHQVLVEFVSANPTGPLHVGHGRQGALGDAMSALLEAQGYAVLREFYYNDAGVQIATLAASVQARAQGKKPGDAAWPESAYNGDYIADIAADFLAKKTVSAANGEPVTGSGDLNDIESIRRFAVTYLRHEQDLDLQAFGVRFDNYYLESSLYTEGKVAATVAAPSARVAIRSPSSPACAHRAPRQAMGISDSASALVLQQEPRHARGSELAPPWPYSRPCRPSARVAIRSPPSTACAHRAPRQAMRISDSASALVRQLEPRHARESELSPP